VAETLLNILVVEDDALDVMNIQRAFKKANLNHPLYIASNGIEALQQLRDGTVPAERRLVLLDINMPRMNGLEFLRELRADPRLHTTTVVMLTTSNEDKDRKKAYELHVAGYFLKPVTFVKFVELMTAVHEYWTVAHLP
jgi:CheY-like chemotaxis protein